MKREKMSQYSGNLKRSVYYLTDDEHARFITKLEFDKIKASMFMRCLIQAYVDDDPNIRAFVDRGGKFKISKETLKERAREDKKIKLQKAELNLDNEQIEEIFDILERDRYE
jgi:hypothetical protein